MNVVTVVLINNAMLFSFFSITFSLLFSIFTMTTRWMKKQIYQENDYDECCFGLNKVMRITTNVFNVVTCFIREELFIFDLPPQSVTLVECGYCIAYKPLNLCGTHRTITIQKTFNNRWDIRRENGSC